MLVKPKDASTLIIIKRRKKESLVLMGKRPLESRFMPGVYVFPGGVAEKEDIKACKIFKIKKTQNIKIDNLKAKSYNHALSLMLAAIRETAEETGLYLIKKKATKEIDIFKKETTWQDFIKKSYFPDIDKLFLFGRAITPSKMKIRFHARFFIAFYEDFVGKIKTNGELDNLGWVSLDKAKNKKIADVTEFMLDEIIKLKNDYSKLSSKKNFPMFTWRNNKKWVKWDNNM